MFRMREAGLRHRAIAVPHLFAPAAELLLDALEVPADGACVLCLEPGSPLLFGAACQDARLRARRLLQVAERETATDQAPAAEQHRVLGDPWFLPLRAGSCDLVLANLLLGDAEMDGALLRELQRVLRPGGQLVATALLAGTFEEFFDLAQEYCENQGLADSRAALGDERANLYRPASLQRALESRGFKQVRVGIENRAAPFESGREFVEDAVVQEVFLTDWTRTLGDALLRRRALLSVAQAIDTYFAGIGFTARLVTGVVTARRA